MNQPIWKHDSDDAISTAAQALGKRRWQGSAQSPAEIGRLGGRPKSDAPRCACGAMTLKRALARGHKCEKGE